MLFSNADAGKTTVTVQGHGPEAVHNAGPVPSGGRERKERVRDNRKPPVRAPAYLFISSMAGYGCPITPGKVGAKVSVFC